MSIDTTEITNDNTFIPEHDTMTRHEKIEFLKETTTEDFHTNTLLEEMVSWMSEDDFSKFYDHLCSSWDVARSYEELNEQYGE